MTTHLRVPRPDTVWEIVEGELKPFGFNQRGEKVELAWAPQPGSQRAFYQCPLFEVLYCGTRGPGKTDALLMDFGRHCGPEKVDAKGNKVAGWGSEWRGVIFRQSYPQLSDIVAKSKKWFPRIWPGISFNEQKMTWKWTTGEELLLRHMSKEDDYYSYHGHAYPWIGWEELTTWADDKCYKLMMSCSRSTAKGMPRKYRSTTNPYGVGHNWVKSRFQIRSRSYPDIIGKVVDYTQDELGKAYSGPPLQRVAIHGFLCENKVLLTTDPGYEAKIRSAARNPAELAAWLDGSWDIVAGGMFDDVWSPDIHILPYFEVPKSWSIERSFDWGSSKPFSVGWWARSDGTNFVVRGQVRRSCPGDLYRVAEWYGWSGQPNDGVRMTATEIGLGVTERERRLFPNRQIVAGPADSSIWTKINNMSIAEDLEAVGCYFTEADKSPGSREQGWHRMRSMFKEARNPLRENPGMFVTETCDQFIRTVPVLPRDQKKPDDVDTDAEDHIGDEARYMALTRNQLMGIVSIAGR